MGVLQDDEMQASGAVLGHGHWGAVEPREAVASRGCERVWAKRGHVRCRPSPERPISRPPGLLQATS